MTKLRIIPRLDIKSSSLIKSIRLEGLRKLGPIQVFLQNVIMPLALMSYCSMIV